jgi:hypothetical protein
MLSFVHDYTGTPHFSDDAAEGKEFPFDINAYWELFLLGKG